MKKSYAFLAFLLASNLVFGQVEWVGTHVFSEAAADVIRTSQGHYVLLHGNGSGFTVFHENGAIVAQDTTFYFTSDGQSDLIELADSSLIFVAGGVDCDVVINLFSKYDKNWNRTAYKYCNGGHAIAEFSDHSIAITDGFYGYVEKLSANGDQLWLWDIYSNSIRDLVVIPGDTLLAASDEGVIWIKSNGEVIDTIANMILDRLEMLPNGNLLAQVNNALYLFSTSFAPLGYYQVQSATIDDIAIQNYEIAVLTSKPEVIRLDPLLEQIAITPLNGHNQTFTAVSYSNNGFMLGGGEQYGNNDHKSTASFIKSFAHDGTTINTARDLALTQISTNGQINIEDQIWIYAVTIPSFSITVQNNGNTNIHRLNLNLDLPVAVLSECYENQSISKPYENLNLEPGGSIVINWGEQVVYFNDDPSDLTLEFCAWPSLPNNHLETNNDNDVACTTALLLADHEPAFVDFNNAFNAATDILYLEFNSPIKSATANIYNSMGQLMQTAQINELSGQLDMSGLPDGAYFINIQAGNQLGWGRFTKY